LATGNSVAWRALKTTSISIFYKENVGLLNSCSGYQTVHTMNNKNLKQSTIDGIKTLKKKKPQKPNSLRFENIQD
jgi:hypothetical protein